MAHDALRDDFFARADRYEYQGTLGRGGMGIVYKALDRELGEIIAIKVLSTFYDQGDTSSLMRFKREISLNRRIKHPNVARLFDFGMSGPHAYVTMEFVPGRDFSRVIRAAKRIPANPAISILRQIAMGTSAAHDRGIIHRDLKPQNVMVDEEGAVAILDFGLARGLASPGLTQDGIAVGTPHYMSPEQARGKQLDARTDLYSIGVIAFEALTGHVPFDGESPLVIALQHTQSPVPVQELEARHVPSGLIRVVLKCLEKECEDRYATARELETALGLLGGTVTRRSASTSTGALAGAEHDVRARDKTGDKTGVRAGAKTGEATPLDLQFSVDAGQYFWSSSEGEARPSGSPTPIVPHVPHPLREPEHRPVVLVVDDDPSIRGLLSMVLEGAGIVVRQAGSGRAAIEELLASPADLVVMDVKMPDVDGFDATRIIKSQKALKELPVILISGVLDRSRLAFAIQAGATDFLAKPLDTKEVVRKVRLLLEQRGFPPTA